MFLSPGMRAKQRFLAPIAGVGVAISKLITGYKVSISQSFLTASTSVNISLTTIGTYFDGPTVAQGTSGTWFATGNVSLKTLATGPDIFFAKLWDGTTVIDSGGAQSTLASDANIVISLSGVLSSPAGNIRISVDDQTSSQGLILANTTGNAKDSTVTVIRIG
jgi:hypothetical protein